MRLLAVAAALCSTAVDEAACLTAADDCACVWDNGCQASCGRFLHEGPHYYYDDTPKPTPRPTPQPSTAAPTPAPEDGHTDEVDGHHHAADGTLIPDDHTDEVDGHHHAADGTLIPDGHTDEVDGHHHHTYFEDGHYHDGHSDDAEGHHHFANGTLVPDGHTDDLQGHHHHTYFADGHYHDGHTDAVNGHHHTANGAIIPDGHTDGVNGHHHAADGTIIPDGHTDSVNGHHHLADGSLVSSCACGLVPGDGLDHEQFHASHGTALSLDSANHELRHAALFHPKFPDTWTATIEANLGSAGYTLTRREVFSKEHDAIRVHNHNRQTGEETVLISHFGANVSYRLTTSVDMAGDVRTSCKMSEFVQRGPETGYSNNHLRGTGSFLAMSGDNWDRAALKFGGQQLVRGVPNDHYFRRVLARGSSLSGNSSGSDFTLSYFYPHAEYQPAQLQNYTVPSRVAVAGTSSTGKVIDHTYEFVDFRPMRDREVHWAFDHCLTIHGTHDVQGCGCEKHHHHGPDGQPLPGHHHEAGASWDDGHTHEDDGHTDAADGHHHAASGTLISDGHTDAADGHHHDLNGGLHIILKDGVKDGVSPAADGGEGLSEPLPAVVAVAIGAAVGIPVGVGVMVLRSWYKSRPFLKNWAPNTETQV